MRHKLCYLFRYKVVGNVIFRSRKINQWFFITVIIFSFLKQNTIVHIDIFISANGCLYNYRSVHAQWNLISGTLTDWLGILHVINCDGHKLCYLFRYKIEGNVIFRFKNKTQWVFLGVIIFSILKQNTNVHIDSFIFPYGMPI